MVISNTEIRNKLNTAIWSGHVHFLFGQYLERCMCDIDDYFTVTMDDLHDLLIIDQQNNFRTPNATDLRQMQEDVGAKIEDWINTWAR